MRQQPPSKLQPSLQKHAGPDASVSLAARDGAGPLASQAHLPLDGVLLAAANHARLGAIALLRRLSQNSKKLLSRSSLPSCSVPAVIAAILKSNVGPPLVIKCVWKAFSLLQQEAQSLSNVTVLGSSLVLALLLSLVLILNEVLGMWEQVLAILNLALEILK